MRSGFPQMETLTQSRRSPAHWRRSSPALDPSIEIVVCIPCFRRPQHLRQTLESLANQRTGRRFAVVMVENDASRSESVPVATEFFWRRKTSRALRGRTAAGQLPRDQRRVRDRAGDVSGRDQLLMIDDDEIASPDWLERMVSRGRDHRRRSRRRAGLPDFDDELKRGLRRHPAFAPAYDDVGPVPVIYGCGNCLIRRAGVRSARRSRFRSALQFPRRRRHRLLLCAAGRPACGSTGPRKPSSPKPCRASRTNPRWLVVRGLRIGAINYHVELKAARTGWPRARLLAQDAGDAAAVAVSRRPARAHGAQGAHCDASDDGRGRQRAGGASASNRNPTKPRRSCVSQLATTPRFGSSSARCGVSR